MRRDISRVLVEALVKTTLNNLKEDSERGVRNLIDMALQNSEGRFQRRFFSTAQTMLQNENSAYYRLVKETIADADTQRLYTFGMNLGYNACTAGARRIRETETKLQCNIPWTVALQIDSCIFENTQQTYHTTIREGEDVGIFAWLLFTDNDPHPALTLVKEHPDSAFFLFCEAETLSGSFLENVSELYNLMLVVRYDESLIPICTTMRTMGLLYSVWYPYGQSDVKEIINGDLYCSTQELSPVFTVLLSKPGCPKEIQESIHQSVQEARSEQNYHTIPWEMKGDNMLIDAIISEDSCFAYFNAKGDLCDQDGVQKENLCNLFCNSLPRIFKIAYPKKQL